MTVKRVMGTETEYAVSLNTPDRYNPVQLSFDVVNGAPADSQQIHPLGLPAGGPGQRRARHPTSNAPPPDRTCSPTPHNSTSPT